MRKTEYFYPTKQITTLPFTAKKALCVFGRYFNGNLYRFVLDKDQKLKLQLVEHEVDDIENNESKTDKPLPLVIVARKFYNEQAKSYPIESKSELNKLLKLEFNEQPLTKYHIWKKQEGQSLVNIWQFEKTVPVANILLPESLLLSLANEEQKIAEIEIIDKDKNNHTLFVGKDANGLIHSSLSSAGINSYQRFIMATGLTHNQTNRKIPQDTLAEELSLGFNGNIWRIIPHFILPPSEHYYSQLLKKIMVPFSLVFVLYLTTSSLYLVTKQYYLNQGLLGQTEQVEQAITQQQNFDNNLERYTTLQTFLIDKKNSASLWLIMQALFEHAQFTNIRIDNGRYILRGSTDRATDLLEIISQFSNVSDAKFDFPTRNNRGSETFVIGFVLNGEFISSPKDAQEHQNSIEQVGLNNNNQAKEIIVK